MGERRSQSCHNVTLMYLGLEQMLQVVEEQEISCSVLEDLFISEPKDLQHWPDKYCQALVQVLSLKSKSKSQILSPKSRGEGL